MTRNCVPCFRHFISERSEAETHCIARENKLECPKAGIFPTSMTMKAIDVARDATAEDEEIKPCLNCMAPNPESAAVCSGCGAAFFGANNLVPTHVIRSEGAMWQKLVSDNTPSPRPTMLKLVAVWIILLPIFLGSAGLAVTQAYDRNGFQSFVFFWIGSGLAYFAGTVLYRVTRDFVKVETSAADRG